MLVTHANKESPLGHAVFRHLNYKYLQQINREGMVTRIPNIQSFEGFFHGYIMGKHLEDI